MTRSPATAPALMLALLLMPAQNQAAITAANHASSSSTGNSSAATSLDTNTVLSTENQRSSDAHTDSPSAALSFNKDIKDPYSSANLPELGQPADLVADKDTEQRLGQAVLRQLQGSTATWPDTLVRDYLENLIYHLAMYTTLQDPKFSIVVINDREVNAFAVPGDVIGVNTGLILTAESEDELAGVLSHELGHLSQRHFARSQEANKYNQWLALGGVLATVAAAASGAGSAGLAAGLSAQAIAAQNQLRYSRNYEQEADRIGLQTLTQSGYDPRGMPNFFLRLDRATRQLGYVPEFLLTHPLSSSRLSDLERRVRETPRKLKAVEPDFRYVQVRLQVAYSENLSEMISAFQERMKLANPSTSTRYGLSLALLRNGEPAAADVLLAPLLKSDPNRLEFQLSAIDILLAQRNYARALQLSERSHGLFPEKRSVLERLAQAALALKQPERIRPLLEVALRQYPNDPMLWRLLSDCAASQQDAQTVFRARAEFLFYNNRQRPAEAQMKNALKMAQNNYSLTAQLDKRLADMRKQDAEFNH